ANVIFANENRRRSIRGHLIIDLESTLEHRLSARIYQALFAREKRARLAVVQWLIAGGTRLVEEVAEVDEVLLAGGAFGEVGLRPFGDELIGGESGWAGGRADGHES